MCEVLVHYCIVLTNFLIRKSNQQFFALFFNGASIHQQVYNSRTQSHLESLIIKEFNGNERAPQVVFSDRTYLTIFFHIDTLNTIRGFEATFDAVGMSVYSFIYTNVMKM